jgi:hypothetical protein
MWHTLLYSECGRVTPSIGLIGLPKVAINLLAGMQKQCASIVFVIQSARAEAEPPRALHIHQMSYCYDDDSVLRSTVDLFDSTHSTLQMAKYVFSAVCPPSRLASLLTSA